MPQINWPQMGRDMYMARFVTLEEAEEFIAFMQANKFGRINYTEYIRYQQDVAVSEDIIEAARELGVTDKQQAEEIADTCFLSPGSYRRLTREDIREIFASAY